MFDTKKVHQFKDMEFGNYEIRVREVISGDTAVEYLIFSTTKRKKPAYLEPGARVIMFFKVKEGAAYFVNKHEGLKFFDENGFKPNQFNEEIPSDSGWQDRPVKDFIDYLRTVDKSSLKVKPEESDVKAICEKTILAI